MSIKIEINLCSVGAVLAWCEVGVRCEPDVVILVVKLSPAPSQSRQSFYLRFVLLQSSDSVIISVKPGFTC